MKLLRVLVVGTGTGATTWLTNNTQPSRIAALLRELADAFDDTDAGKEDGSPRRRASAPRQRRPITRPVGEATPAVAAQAKRILRDRGFS